MEETSEPAVSDIQIFSHHWKNWLSIVPSLPNLAGPFGDILSLLMDPKMTDADVSQLWGNGSRDYDCL